jgi:hypothetical protein
MKQPDQPAGRDERDERLQRVAVTSERTIQGDVQQQLRNHYERQQHQSLASTGGYTRDAPEEE